MFENQENKENESSGGNNLNRGTGYNTPPSEGTYSQDSNYQKSTQSENKNSYENNQSYYHPYQNDYHYSNQGNQGYNESQNYSAGQNYSSPTDNGMGGNIPPIPPTPEKVKKIKIKKPAGSHKFLKRAITVVACGLGFGLCLGLGVYVVGIATGTSLLTASNKSETALESTVQEMQNTINNLVKQTGSSTTDATTLKTSTGSTVVTDVTDVVANAMPSVVSVTNTYTESAYNLFGQAVSGDATSTGSGIIVGENDTELLVVTNYHVIADADKLTVQFIDGTTLDAQIKGSDSDMDLAILAIPLDTITADTMSKIAVATLGDSDSLQVGEPAIAIGNALGYGQSVTTGVISAVNRPIAIDEVTTKNFIQTDAAINPGNSGGALLNINGEVIGINSNKIGGEAIEGMGYAIPISAAIPIIQNLMTKETLVKVDDSQSSYLGIGGVDVTAELATAYSMPEGVYVTQIYDNSAAAQYGIEKGDVITAFDGQPVANMAELQNMMQYYAAGTKVDVTVMRISKVDYEQQVISVTLGSKADAATN